MAFDKSVLDRPVDGDDPCGPDLEAAGDPDFLAFLATVEGAMPASFFSFDPGSLDHEAILGQAAGLLGRTRDVRLLVLLAKVLILSRDFPGFVRVVEAIRGLLAETWEEVHPRADDDGDYAFRLAPLFNLDDAASLVFPLQFAPLVQAPRLGAATYRWHLLATGAARPREGERSEGSELEQILSKCDLDDLVAARDLALTLKAAIAGIERTLIERIGYDAALNLDRLPPVVEGMAAMLDAAVIRRDPSRAADALPAAETEEAPAEEADGAEEAAAAPIRAGSIRDQAEAAAALDAALAYYRGHEPSSPAIPLLEQARASVGRSLFEVMAMLMPQHAEAARIHVGGEPAFVVPVKAGRSEGNGLDSAAAVPPVATRREAQALLDQVTQYFRQAEPSSPVPLLLDRARALGSRDFLSLLKDLLPEEALKTMKAGG